MLDYLIGHKQIILAWVIGGFLGGILSVIVDTYFLDLYETQNYKQVIKKAILTGITTSSILGLMTAIFLVIDYRLSSTSPPTYLIFAANDSFLGGFVWSLVLAMGNTIIIFSERALSSKKSD